MTRFGCFVDLPCHGEHPAEPALKCVAVASFCFLPQTPKSPVARAAVAGEQPAGCNDRALRGTMNRFLFWNLNHNGGRK